MQETADAACSEMASFLSYSRRRVLLTEKHYGICLRDLLKHNPKADWDDIAVLSAGRQFRFGSNKIIVGRRDKENIKLMQLKKEKDILLECENPIMGPVTLLQGPNSPKSMMLAARLTAYFSDARKEGIKKVKVNCWKEWNGKISRPYKQIIVSPNLDIEKETKKGLKWIGQAKP
jgi:Tat protein secretion system quality control protein TatD with DNase activity